jgi:hypothetical protein
METMLRAYDPTLQREVTLERVHRRPLGAEGARQLAREARAMAKLSQQNVAGVLAGPASDAGLCTTFGVQVRFTRIPTPRTGQGDTSRFQHGR